MREECKQGRDTLDQVYLVTCENATRMLTETSDDTLVRGRQCKMALLTRSLAEE